MTIDTTYMGYGAGLVMVGWICGMIVGLVLNTIRTIAKHI